MTLSLKYKKKVGERNKRTAMVRKRMKRETTAFLHKIFRHVDLMFQSSSCLKGHIRGNVQSILEQVCRDVLRIADRLSQLFGYPVIALAVSVLVRHDA